MRRAVLRLACTATRHAGRSSQVHAAAAFNALRAPAISVPAGPATASHFRSFASSIGGQDEFAYDSFISYPAPRAFVGQPAPTWTAPAVVDEEITEVSLSDYLGKWVVFFWYPKDWTFVCPTEIIAFSDRAKEFEALGCQVVGASTDTENSHLAWIKHPRDRGGLGLMQIPLIADPTRAIAADYGVLLQDKGIALRGLFIINPEGVVQQITINDLPVGRSVDETLRQLQALQFVREHGEVCPADWQPGGDTMVADPDKSLDYFAKAAKKSEAGQGEWGATLRPIEGRKDFEELVGSGKKVVVDFLAPWCGKCRMIAPFVEQLQQTHPDIVFAKFDTTSEPLAGLSSELKVQGLPTFLFYKDGKQALPPVIGYKKKPLEEAVAQL